MAENLSYWYDGFNSGTLTSELPIQAIPNSQKTDNWKKRTMDALERIGIKQFDENKRFVDYYRMCEGKVSYIELAELAPQLREVSSLLENFQLNTSIKHYDLLGVIVNYLTSVIAENKDKFTPIQTGEIATNEYEREKTKLLQQYIKEQWDKELELRLLEEGYDLEKTNFNSEEEKQAHIQQIQNRKKELTPPEIEEYVNKKWRPIQLEWARATLEHDNKRFNKDELDRKHIKNFLLSGRCFEHHFCNYDSYGVEAWSPINTFFSQTIDTEYVQNGEYVGRIHFYTPSDFINKYGQHFNEIEKRKILNQTKIENTDDLGGTLTSDFANSTGKIQGVPFEQYNDYNFMLGVQEHFGVPIASQTIYKKDGTTESFPTFLPGYNSDFGRVHTYAKLLREDLNLRTDMIMVVEAYWRGWERVGYLTYITETGLLTSTIVTDELLPEFLKEMGIDEVRNISLEEAKKGRKPNTIVWDYRPQVWKGKKANTSLTKLGKDSYFDINPLEFQLKGDSNIFDVQIPVCGIVDKSPADKILPWQNKYNIVVNQEHNLLEKEIGAFFLFDINFLPSDIKEYGDTETSLLHFRNIVKETGLFGVDGSGKNMQGNQRSSFNQFSAVDMSLTNQIVAKQQQALYYKQEAFSQFGLSNQLIAQPMKNVTATAIETVQVTTNSQTEPLFASFNFFKQKSLEMGLAVAQYAQGSGKDITVDYTKGDLSRAVIKFKDNNFPLRTFGIMPLSDAKGRRQVQEFKNYLLTNNTQDTDSLEIASILQSEAMVSLIEIARIERMRKEQNILAERQHEKELADAQIQATQLAIDKQNQLESIEKERDRINKLDVARIAGLSKASDDSSTMGGLNFINDEADRSVSREQNAGLLEAKNRELDIRQEEAKTKYKDNADKLSIELQKLALKREELKTSLEISRMNKN